MAEQRGNAEPAMLSLQPFQRNAARLIILVHMYSPRPEHAEVCTDRFVDVGVDMFDQDSVRALGYFGSVVSCWQRNVSRITVTMVM